MAVSSTTKIRLALRSGNRCAFPGCDRPLTVDNESGHDMTTTGEAAHIAGERNGSARYNPNMTNEERDHYHNLIYMCGDHHKQIDDFCDDFPISRLLEMKKNHEAKVCEGVTAAFAEVGFPELEYATQRIRKMTGVRPSEDFTVTPPKEKLRKNELTSASELIIKTGLGIIREVHTFVERESVIDANFPERLKAGFLEEYYRLRREGHRGDALFDLMCNFAQQGMKEQSQRSAGLAILTYLFDLCEVFEK